MHILDEEMAIKLCIFGDPVAHSRSPSIHERFAQQLGVQIDYEKRQVKQGTLQQAIHQFKQEGGVGANVTLPLKEEAYALCHQLSREAQLAHAVNTLYWDQQNHLIGANTDGQGFIQDLCVHHRQSPTEKNVLLLGAGGASLGLVGPLLAHQPAQLVLCNRTLEKAHSIVAQFASPKLRACDYSALKEQTFDIVINATSVSLHQGVLPLPKEVVMDAFVYDLVYSLKEPLPFLQWAHSHGAKATVDGLGMLIEQAALSFELWVGQKPNTIPVLSAFKAKEI